MTVGQRVAQKRRELGLSQEALGERLGVSRQAIYKWESDAALPEIEKLVNLSREFSVPVGWLLGEEDEAPERPELTAEQLRMVEEIVGRYLAAQPRPEPPAQDSAVPEKKAVRRGESLNWLVSVVLKIVAFVVALNLGVLLLWRQEELEERYRSLQNSISAVSSDVNSQIHSITNRVEEALQSQNSLTAEQSAEVTATDYRANTATISARAVPRTYVEGISAEFILASGGHTFTVPGELGEGHVFTAEATVPLSDDITVSVALVTGEQRETQVVGQFEGLYARSLVMVDITTNVCESSAGVWYAAPTAEIAVYQIDDGSPPPKGEAEIKLGLFREQKLAAWYIPAEDPDPNDIFRAFTLEVEGGVPLEMGVPYCLAALVSDQYGRTYLCPGQVMKCGEGVAQSVHVTYSADPADWEY